MPLVPDEPEASVSNSAPGSSLQHGVGSFAAILLVPDEPETTVSSSAPGSSLQHGVGSFAGIQAGDWVAVIYDSQWYPGKIIFSIYTSISLRYHIFLNSLLITTIV